MDSPIEILSDDVLLEIFEYLDARTLKKAALVCKNWNDVISLSPSTMKKFTLRLSNHNAQGLMIRSMWTNHFDEVMSLQRKFQAMSVHLESSHYKQAVDLVIEASSQYGSQIRSLTFFDSNFESLGDFAELMESFPLLEELALIKTTLKPPTSEEISKIKPVVFKKLKKLNVSTGCWAFFQCLIGSQVTYLSVSNRIARITDRECLVRFLEASKKIEAIDIDSRVFVRLFEFSFRETFPFRLKNFKFHWHFPTTDVGDADKNFDKFLLHHATSLEELELNYVSPDQVRTIFSKLTAIRKLRINATSLPSEKEFYDQLRPLKSLKELIAHDKIPNENAARGILGSCPNLETLFLLHDPDSVASILLPFMALNNLNMKSLSLETLAASIDAKFNCLKFLHLNVITSMDFLKSFLALNRSIDTLSIRSPNGEMSHVQIVDDLMLEGNLKHLKFAGSFSEIKAVFDKVKVNYKQLKSLELTLDIESKTGKQSEIFIFPEDFNTWNPRCEFFDSSK